jgi:hypothetical protein
MVKLGHFYTGNIFYIRTCRRESIESNSGKVKMAVKIKKRMNICARLKEFMQIW